MIARAKQVMPGMLITLLLSVPAMAGTTDGETSGAKDSAPTFNARSHASRHVKTAAEANTSASQADRAAKAVPSGRASGRSAAAARSRLRDVTPASIESGNGQTLHTANSAGSNGSIDRNLIDDGTLWRERGSVATWQQTGLASWYGGERWQGHQTSSGSRYDQNELTAAHATLPLGTKVRVTSHSGARSVIVTINDRPGTRTRIIDLSRQAAKELGILDAGVAMVTLQPM